MAQICSKCLTRSLSWIKLSGKNRRRWRSFKTSQASLEIKWTRASKLQEMTRSSRTRCHRKTVSLPTMKNSYLITTRQWSISRRIFMHHNPSTPYTTRTRWSTMTLRVSWLPKRATFRSKSGNFNHPVIRIKVPLVLSLSAYLPLKCLP